jgi:hypothetical protein
MPRVKNRSMQMQRFSALMVAVYPAEGLEEPTHFEFLSNTFIPSAKQILKSLSSRLILSCANSATMLIRYSIFCLDKINKNAAGWRYSREFRRIWAVHHGWKNADFESKANANYEHKTPFN